MDDLVITEQKGGTTPSASPHACPYAPTGADVSTCTDLTLNFQRNLGGCVKVRCNARTRKCYRCVELGRGKNAGTVVDPKIGLCEEHATVVEARPAIPAHVRLGQPVFAARGARRPVANTGKDPAMRALALRFWETRKTQPHAPVLAETEVPVVGAAREPVEEIPSLEDITEMVTAEASAASDAVDQFDLVRDSDVVPEASNDTGLVFSDPEHEASDVEVPQVNDDDEEVIQPPPAQAEDAMTTPAVKGALKVSAQLVAAAKDENMPRPKPRELFNAVEALISAEEMTRKQIGIEFGQTDASAAAWVSTVFSFNRFNDVVWKTIGDYDVPLHVLKAAAVLKTPKEQSARIQSWIDKKGSKNAGRAPRATVNNNGEKSGKRAAASSGNGKHAPDAKNGSTAVVVANGHDDANGFNLPVLSAKPSPADIVDFTIGLMQGVGKLRQFSGMLGNAVDSARSLDLHEAKAAQMFGAEIDQAIAEMQRVRGMFIPG